MPVRNTPAIISKARRGGRLDADDATCLAEAPPEALDDLLEAASYLRDSGHGRTISYAL